jgi:glycosyltransferase involved in cell wall biosynthesis/ubiquinone/menaquinone biosynthesis C-methylase UbiE
MSKHINQKVMILTHGLYPIPGYTVSGNGIRAWGLAMGLVHHGFDVVYSTPSDTVHPHTPPPEVTLAPYSDKANLHQLIAEHKPTVLIVGYWAYMHLLPADMDIPVVMDLLAPWLLEAEFQESYDMEVESIDYIKCLSQADYFLCCTQRQKAFHTAWLFMSGLGCKNNPLDVIPISANPDLPIKPATSLEKGPIFLYGGVLWPWRSPETWLSQLLDILVAENNGQLQLITGKYPLHEASSSGNLQLSKETKYQNVLKQSDLLPYDEMEQYYLQADIGIELSAKNCEREFSFSFRIIEYLRCGLPVICNDFLEVAELIKSYDAGWVLDSNDDNALEKVVKRIVSGQEDLSQKRANAQRLIKDKFNYYQTIEPLIRFCNNPRKLQKSKHFLLSLVQHDQNVHDLQSNITALQTQLDDKEAVIAQFKAEREHLIATHNQAVSWSEKTQTVLYQHYEQAREQLAQWQRIAEERRLSSRLKRLSPFNRRVSETYKNDLFEAAEQNKKINLQELSKQLPLNPQPELLKTEQQPFDYQLIPLERLFLYTDLKDKTVLEIGADDAVLLSRLAQKGMHLGVGINNWYWNNKPVKTVKVSDNIILSHGDIRSVPLQDASFDIIFTVAAFEHIHELEVALAEMYRLLKPGGLVYSFYGPLWSSGVGHHLWFERAGTWYRFSDEASTAPILKNYEHLLFDKQQMKEKLNANWDQASVDDFLYQIYDTDHINRYMYADYIRMFNASDFKVVHLENFGKMAIEPEVHEQLRAKFGDENDFTCATLEVVLKKPDADQTTATLQQPKSGIQKLLNKISKGIALTYRAIVKRLLIPLVQRWGKQNLAIITRDDVFPVDHGAAAKIFHTARVLSYDYEEVYLITLDRDKFYIFRQGDMSEELYPRFLRNLWYPTEGFLRDKLTAAGIPNKESFLFFPKLDKNFKLRVLYVALQKRINVYQAEFPAFMDACSWAYKLFRGKRSIVEHNIEYQRISDTYQLDDTAKNYLKEYEVKLCNLADYVITVSQNDTQGLIEAGVAKDKITMISHGVDLENFDAISTDSNEIRNRYGISENDIVLMFHGIYSYAPNGDAAKLIGDTVLPKLNAKGYYPKCLAVGKYPPENSNHPDLIYTDVVEHVAPYTKTADIAIVPLQDGGGTRMKILEYFAAAVPVIATAKGAEGIEVIPGKDILIEEDMEKFVDQIILLIENSDKRQQIGQAGRYFVEQLDWRKIGKRYVKLYHN